MKKLPVFPEFGPVCLADRAYLENIFMGIQPEVSEFNFTNLFMFRHVHDYKLSVLNGNVVILAKSYGGERYFMPPIGENDVPGTVASMMGYMKDNGYRPEIQLASKEFIEKYIEGKPGFGYEPDRDSSDYLYSAKELMTLTGRKFHDKKNLKNRFMKSSGYEYRRLTSELVPLAKDLVQRWCCEKCTVEVPSTFGETDATMLALDNLDSLSLTGGVVVIAGDVMALSLGEELNRDTVVIHVEKANSAFPGLYQYISSEFLAREFPGYTYVNREQDLGEPNLRKSKVSYNPIRMVEKYKVWPIY